MKCERSHITRAPWVVVWVSDVDEQCGSLLVPYTLADDKQVPLLVQVIWDSYETALASTGTSKLARLALIIGTC